MRGYTHRYVGGLAGVCLAAAISKSADVSLLATCAVAGVVGGSVPDIDKRGSHISNRLPILSWITEKTLGHRGVLHTPFALLLLELGILWLAQNGYINSFVLTVCQAFILGYFSHLLLDFLTPRGIMLLYPLSRKYSRFLGLKSGLREPAAIVLVTAAAGMLIYRH